MKKIEAVPRGGGGGKGKWLPLILALLLFYRNN
jgi:hypothetical protein